eukprot:TRINITY_DN2008_c0_g1_i1.p1 TRINITY_DN2008_c0_g1~~TRINITY_DN2008_c0_g1_i1.p1  ORF type:complete len:233 (+),score=15.75 TRINITY_DN2008_c0_g1_i1:51-701(+)
MSPVGVVAVLSVLLLVLPSVCCLTCRSELHTGLSGAVSYRGPANAQCWSVWPMDTPGYAADIITFSFANISFNAQTLKVFQGGVAIMSNVVPDFVLTQSSFDGVSLTRRLRRSSGRAWIQFDQDSTETVSFDMTYKATGSNQSPGLSFFFGLLMIYLAPLIVVAILSCLIKPKGDDILNRESRFLFRRRLRFAFWFLIIFCGFFFVFGFLRLPRTT